jgi:hypothetical protein
MPSGLTSMSSASSGACSRAATSGPNVAVPSPWNDDVQSIVCPVAGSVVATTSGSGSSDTCGTGTCGVVVVVVVVGVLMAAVVIVVVGTAAVDVAGLELEAAAAPAVVVVEGDALLLVRAAAVVADGLDAVVVRVYVVLGFAADDDETTVRQGWRGNATRNCLAAVRSSIAARDAIAGEVYRGQLLGVGGAMAGGQVAGE